MSQPVNTQKRRTYRSAVRTEQASVTKQRIVDAARRLFLDRGYASTTIAAVADAAGVSQESIYAILGGKRGLLEAVIDAVIPVLPEQDAALDAIGDLPSSRARLRAFVSYCCGILARTSPIHEVIRGAADSESFATELRARLLSERLASQKRHLAEHVRLEPRAGLTSRQAAERFCALTSPELHHVTITELGWSRRRHEEWITELVERELVDA